MRFDPSTPSTPPLLRSQFYCMMALLMAAGGVFGENFKPTEITHHGDIDPGKAVPRFEVRHQPATASTPPADPRWDDRDVVLVMEGEGSLVLARYRLFKADDPFTKRMNEFMRDTVYLDLVKAGEQLELDSAQVYYQTQERDSLRDVARHFLGPFAQAEALTAANPHLPAGLGPVSDLPVDTRLRIPVPSDWVARYFGIGDLSPSIDE